MTRGVKSIVPGLILLAAALGATGARADATNDFAYCADVTASGYAGTTTLTNFPLLVRVSETLVPGFTYDSVCDASSVRFYAADGVTVLPSECDTWNAAGESLFWVRVPELAGTATKVRMAWGAPLHQTALAMTPSAVWGDYAGVWHMGTTTDSTVNNTPGTFGASRIAAPVAKFGTASGTTTTGVNGAILVAQQDDAINAISQTNGFSISLWVYLNTASIDWAYLYSRMEDDNTTAYGAQFRDGGGKNNLAFRYAGGGNGNFYSVDTSALATESWQKLDVVYSGNTIAFYLNGALVKYNTGCNNHIQNGTDDFSIGGLVGTTGHGTFNGNIDEFRLRAKTVTADWIAADYKQANDGFLTYGAAKTNAFDYIRTATSRISPTTWAVGETPTVTPGAFRAADGSILTATVTYFNVNTAKSSTELPTAAGSYTAIFTYAGLDVVDEIPLTVTHDTTFTQTQSDRVLVFSYDKTVSGSEITDRQYYTNTSTNNPVYWKRLNTLANGNKTACPMLQTCNVFEMWTYHSGARLWQLNYCRLGNAYLNTTDATSMASGQNYLPVSANSGRYNNANVATLVGQNRYSAALALENTTESCIYSSCYDEGIGTIYFDAVNGWTSIPNELALEICTNVTMISVDEVTGVTNLIPAEVGVDENGVPLAPTDENCNLEGYVNGMPATNAFGRCRWVTVPAYRYVIVDNQVDATLSGPTNSDHIVLDHGGTGGANSNWFRIRTEPLNIRGPVRFRLRRTEQAGKEGDTTGDTSLLDDKGLALIDNIVVSYPAMTAKIGQYGSYEGGAEGQEDQGGFALGQRGAFSVAFPSYHETNLVARASVDYAGLTNSASAVELGDTGFITALDFTWRWRYLDQQASAWQTVPMTRGTSATDWKTLKPLALTDAAGEALYGVGDIEYAVSATVDAPFYTLADYTGLGIGAPGYSEKIGSIAYAAPAYNGLVGTNDTAMTETTYVRLREGASRFEAVKLFTEENPQGIPMELIDDHQWRGFLPTTNTVTRTAKFWFEGQYPQADGDTVYNRGADNIVSFGCTATSVDTFPYNGSVEADSSNQATITLVPNVTGFISFLLNDSTRALTIAHADHQSFDHWAMSRCDASPYRFFTSQTETNATSSLTVRYPELGTNVVCEFALTERVKSDWQETFSVANAQSLVGYPMNEIFRSNTTPNGWAAEWGSWTPQRWNLTAAKDFALYLSGGELGTLSFVQSDTKTAPNGLDTVAFTARLAQMNSFDDITWHKTGLAETDYTVMAQATYDTTSPNGMANYDFSGFDGAASISLIAGYVPQVGCYEYRVTLYNVNDSSANAQCEHAFYRWEWDAESEAYAPTLLLKTYGDGQSGDGSGKTCSWCWAQSKKKSKAGLAQCLPLGLYNGTSYLNAQYSGMYLSYNCTTGVVQLTAGVSAGTANKVTLADNYDYTDKTFCCIGVTDPNPVTTAGTWGVITKDCPAGVYFPRKYAGSVARPQASDMASVSEGAGTDRKMWRNQPGWAALGTPTELKAEAGWAIRKGRQNWEKNTSGSLWGLHATNSTQKIDVQIQPINKTTGIAGTWTNLATVAVTSFNNATKTIPFQSPQTCNVRLQVGSSATGVVLDSVTLAQWCGDSGSVTNANSGYGYSGSFYYSDGWVSNLTVNAKTARGIVLAPRRAEKATSPVAIRTPFLQGLGSVSFQFRDADPEAQVAVQYLNCNYTQLSGHLNDAADSASWHTVTNLTLGAAAGTRTVYLGQRAPSNGVFRIAIPQATVREALANDTALRDNPNWRALTVMDVFCRNEPKFDDRSWWGWNFLTTGWADGLAGDYARLGDGGDGGVGALNCTATDTSTLQTGEASDYVMNNPFIQSPTFATNCIGEITFKARAWSADTPGYVTVWGAQDGSKQTGAAWTALTNVLVTSTLFHRYTVKCADSQRFASIRFGIANATGVDQTSAFRMNGAKLADMTGATPARVLIDDVFISERGQPEIGFRVGFARPFRRDLSGFAMLADIDSRDEQPLLNEQFGFQAEIEIRGMSEEIDLSLTPEVTVSYYPSDTPWGYENWKDAKGAVLDQKLSPAEGTNLIYRSTSDNLAAFVPPQGALDDEVYGLVQYSFTVRYWNKGETKSDEGHTSVIGASEWKTPTWYYGFDDPNGKTDAKFSPYTVLDTVSPGRAWINEVDYTDVTGSSAAQNAQFVELCFPAGYDMTGWRLLRWNNYGDQYETLFTMGVSAGIPGTKGATGGDANFAFLAVKSPKATVAEADGTWNSSVECLPTDSYGFQLLRPSGIVEQQIVVQGKLGTSPWSRYKHGTNVVAALESTVGGTWQFVGADTNAVTKSVGVYRNAGQAATDWNNTMDRTPAALNCAGQIPTGWFLAPSGTNVWITLSALDGNVWLLGPEGLTSALTVVVPLNTTTNLCFATRPWYKVGSLLRDTTNEVAGAVKAAAATAKTGATNTWTYAFTETERSSVTLQARSGIADSVLARGGLDADDPYAPAILNWLVAGTESGEFGDEISTNACFRGLNATDTATPLSLRERYWLDIDPTCDDWDLRGGIVRYVPKVVRDSAEGWKQWPATVTNLQLGVKLMISNKVDNALSYPPCRLQGLAGERSDEVAAKSWTSETFKVELALDKPAGSGGIDVSGVYWPVREFTFGPESFGAADDAEHPFEAAIEVIDPMCPGSAVWSYGWSVYPASSYYNKWSLNEKNYLQGAGQLKKKDTWDGEWCK